MEGIKALASGMRTLEGERESAGGRAAINANHRLMGSTTGGGERSDVIAGRRGDDESNCKLRGAMADGGHSCGHAISQRERDTWRCIRT